MVFRNHFVHESVKYERLVNFPCSFPLICGINLHLINLEKCKFAKIHTLVILPYQHYQTISKTRKPQYASQILIFKIHYSIFVEENSNTVKCFNIFQIGWRLGYIHAARIGGLDVNLSNFSSKDNSPDVVSQKLEAAFSTKRSGQV